MRIIAYVTVHRWQILRFCIVGVVTFVLNFFLIWLFYGKAEWDYRVAVSCAYVVTVSAHFLLNRSFTYGHRGGSVTFDSARYLFVLFVNYLITLGITSATVEAFGLSPYHGVIFSVMVTAFSSFLLLKHFVFVYRSIAK
ncbi:MAG: GtrA family protein [Methylococcales bacterium]